ncbi:MAG: DNA alkylation repair protein [Calditrichaceae bacterium]
MRLISDVLESLSNMEDPVHAERHRAYHKSNLKFYGLKVPVMRKIAKKAGKSISGRDDLLEFFRQLWTLESFETRSIAVFAMINHIDFLVSDDFHLFYPVFRKCDGWALTDYLATGVLGEFLWKYNSYSKNVDVWKSDDCLWVRRAGILRFISQARHESLWSKEMENIFSFHLKEENFFIRKAIGWTLREWAKNQPTKVMEYVEKNKTLMSGLTYREATKHIVRNGGK